MKRQNERQKKKTFIAIIYDCSIWKGLWFQADNITSRFTINLGVSVKCIVHSKDFSNTRIVMYKSKYFQGKLRQTVWKRIWVSSNFRDMSRRIRVESENISILNQCPRASCNIRSSSTVGFCICSFEYIYLQ